MTPQLDTGLHVYRGALRLFPRDFRLRNGPDMERLFLHLRAQRERTGTPSRFRFWTRLLVDTLTHALRERWGAPPSPPSRTAHGTRILMSNLATDLRFAARTLVQSPLFTVVAVLTLALGMGANTAIFSVVNSVLLRSLPYPEPDAVVWVDEWQDTRSRSLPVAWPNFSDWRKQSRSFTGLTAFNGWTTTVLGADRPLRVRVGGITEDFWKVFPVRPVTGRLTVPADHVEGGPGVVVLREDFWRNELSARPLDEVVLEVAGERLQAIGVVPSALDFPFGAELWRPVFPTSTSRTAHNWRVVGRLAPGVTPEMADQELDAITQAVVADEPADPDFLAEGALVLPLKEQLAGSARRPLLLLLGAAALVLLVACTNLASTLLARGETRQREMAIRASMGADRGRLLRQLLTESLVLAALGGGAGLALAAVLVRTLRSLGTVSLPRLAEISIDPVALAFTAAVVIVTALVFGLLPAFRLSGVDVTPALKAGARGGTLGGGRGVWTALVGSEVALAFVLLVGSGLLVRSFATLLDVDSGVDIEGVVTADVDLSLIKYEEAADHARFYQELEAALVAEPEISHAGVVSAVPLAGVPSGRLDLDGDLSKHTVGGYVLASAGFFDAAGLQLIRGRLFDGRDGPDGAHVVVVSQSFADQAWPGEDPIGRQVSGGGMDAFWQERPFATVIGVVSDVHYRSLAREADPVAYFPPDQRPSRLRFESNMVVRAATGDAAQATAALRRALQRLDPDVPPRFSSMETRLVGSLAERRFTLYLLGAFAGVALLLAFVGIYGVVSYAVARHTREIGIRLALGAQPGAVRKTVLAGAMGMVAVGLVVGVVGAVASTRVLTSLLYGISPTDPVTLVTVTVLLLGAAWVAALLPAQRSTRIDPLDAMRAD